MPFRVGDDGVRKAVSVSDLDGGDDASGVAHVGRGATRSVLPLNRKDIAAGFKGNAVTDAF